MSRETGNTPTAWPPLLRTWLSPFASAEDREAAFKEYGPSTDWTALLATLESQRLAGYCHSLCAAEPWAVELPEAFQEPIRQAWSRTRAQAPGRLRVLSGVLGLAAEMEITVMVMKGPVLVETVYGGDYGARAFTDIDLVVHGEDIEMFLDGLRSKYKEQMRMEMEWETSRAHVGIGPAIIEIHWDLALFYAFMRSRGRGRRQEVIWKRAEKKTFPWGDCQIMSSADTLLHLAEHSVLQHDLRVRPYQQLVEIGHFFSEIDGATGTDVLLRTGYEHGYPTALTAAAMGVLEAFQGAERSESLRAIASQGTARQRRCVKTQLRESCREAQANGLLATLLEIKGMCHAMANFMDGWDNRKACVRQMLLPSRGILAFLLGRPLGRFQYVPLLALYYIVFPLLIPSIVVHMLRQLGEWSAPGAYPDSRRDAS